jgi:CelD/BcsL family acetyltransferase involved in cellulose biosynthesis
LIRIETLRPEFTENYDQYLLRHHGSLIYYCSKYKNFIKALLGCEEEYLLAVEDREIRGVLPLMFTERDGGRVYNSLPYYGSNGGILADNPEANDSLIEAHNKIALRPSTISTTIISNPFVRQEAAAIQHNYSDYRIGQFTNLSFGEDPWNELLAYIDSSARRNVQKAVREGVTVEIDLSAMVRLRDMHQANIEALGGLSKTKDFFALIPRHFTPGEDYDLYVARKEGHVIAGLLLFYFNRTVEYITPAIDHEYRSVQPLSLVLMTAMSEAARRGFTCWNWGGTWVSQTGVYRFKKKWGAVERDYHYYTQLNDITILEWPQEKILDAFPGFYVAPFSALKPEGETV